MPEDKGLGSKFLGLFVESNDKPKEGKSNEDDEQSPSPSAPEQSAADIVAELGGKTVRRPSGITQAPPMPVAAAPLAASAAGGAVPPVKVDFDSIFKSAGMDAADLDRVRKAEELLRTLPAATPLEVKKQIVEASLKTFGFDVSKIVAAGHSQLKALETFVKVNEQQTSKAIADAKAKISQLEEQIINLRVDIDKRTQLLVGTAAAAAQRREQVHSVLEFFNTPTPGPSSSTPQ